MADVVAFLDAVGVERATVVGHSRGSFTARRVAETHPERVARLVLIGSAVTAAQAGDRGSCRRPCTPWRTRCRPSSPASSRPAPSYVPAARGVLRAGRGREPQAAGPPLVWERALDGLLAVDDAADLGRITAPTLLIWGERDALFSREEQDRLAAAIPGAPGWLVYPETGHCRATGNAPSGSPRTWTGSCERDWGLSEDEGAGARR